MEANEWKIETDRQGQTDKNKREKVREGGEKKI